MRLGAIKERRSQRDKGTWKESWERGRDYHAIMVSGQTYGRILNSARKGFKGETSFPKRKIGNRQDWRGDPFWDLHHGCKRRDNDIHWDPGIDDDWRGAACKVGGPIYNTNGDEGWKRRTIRSFSHEFLSLYSPTLLGSLSQSFVFARHPSLSLSVYRLAFPLFSLSVGFYGELHLYLLCGLWRVFAPIQRAGVWKQWHRFMGGPASPPIFQGQVHV